MHARSLRLVGSLLAVAGAVTGCEDAGPSQGLNPESSRQFEDFSRSSRASVGQNEVYVVERDMVFEDQASLFDYWSAMSSSTTRKSVVNLNGGARDIRTDSDTSTGFIDVRWCFDASNWGGTETGDSDGDSSPGESLPTKASVRDALLAGMRAWEGVANVRFDYLSGSDGSTCGDVADFVVTLDESSNCAATGPFPSRETQELTVPICGLPGFLAHHELGHTLGFRHEHIHTDSTRNCPEDSDDDGTDDVNGTDFEELTAFDVSSTMIYAAPCANGFIGNTPVSALDGVGARALYGPPDWWWGPLI